MPEETPNGLNKHLILGRQIPKALFYRKLADQCGIVIDKVEPEVLGHQPAEIGGGVLVSGAPSRHAPTFVFPSAPPTMGHRFDVVQLWGLTQCVVPAFERLASAQWRKTIHMGVMETRRLRRRWFGCHNSAKVRAPRYLVAKHLSAYSLALWRVDSYTMRCTPCV